MAANLTCSICARAMRQGIHDLRLWLGYEADGSSKTQTPGKAFGSKEQMTRLVKVRREVHKSVCPQLSDWLDSSSCFVILYMIRQESSVKKRLFCVLGMCRIFQ